MVDLSIAGVHGCAGCGRNLQFKGRTPHPSERFCGWCVQRLRSGPTAARESIADEERTPAPDGGHRLTRCGPSLQDPKPSRR